MSRENVARPVKIAILLQFLTIDPHFVRKDCARARQNRNFSAVLDDRFSFRVKGLRRAHQNQNFYAVFEDPPSFRAKGLRGARQNRNFSAVDDRFFFVRDCCVSPPS